MAKNSGWKKRYAYLDDYKKGIDGKYVYYGRHYVLEDAGKDINKHKLILGITDILLIAMFIVGGCMDAGAIWGMWYVIVPYAFEALGIFLLCWKTVSLIMEKYPVKEYVYKKTATWFKPTAVITIIACILAVVATVVCMISLSDYIKMAGAIIFLVLELLMILVSILFIKINGKYKWIPDPSEELEQ